MKRFLSTVKAQRPLRTVEVRTSPRPSTAKSGENRDGARFDPIPAIVVPLPRRPLFPGYCTGAYLKNQPTLTRHLTAIGETMVATFMLKDTGDYRGCILRPGLQGQELLERLHPVGTLAEITGPACGMETERLSLFGLHRIRMTGNVVRDDPLTVMVEPLEEEVDDDYQRVQDFFHLNKLRIPKDEVEKAAESILPAFSPFSKFCGLLQCLSDLNFSDPEKFERGFYWYKWGEINMGLLADFGPAVMPVLSKGLHQQALEELNKRRRLELTIKMFERELELDLQRRQFHLDEDSLSEEEKELLAKVRSPKVKSLKLDDPSGFSRGEVLMAISVQMRVRISTLHNCKSRVEVFKDDDYKSCMKLLKDSRMQEHMIGY